LINSSQEYYVDFSAPLKPGKYKVQAQIKAQGCDGVFCAQKIIKIKAGKDGTISVL